MASLLSSSGTVHGDDSRADLRETLNDIRDLRDSLESYQGLEHSLVELAQTTEINHRQLGGQVAELREALVTLTEVTRNTMLLPASNRHAEGRAVDSSASPSVLTSRIQSRYATMMTIAIVAGVLLTGWSIRAYVKTGNPYIAILGLVVVNLAGGIAIVLRRRSVC